MNVQGHVFGQGTVNAQVVRLVGAFAANIAALNLPPQRPLMPRLNAMPEPHMVQAYGIYVLANQHRFVRRLRRQFEPSAHGHRAWGSCFLLMDYLNHHPLRRGTAVMEVGCGWAPAGIFCAKRFGSRVTGLDLDKNVFPYAEILATLNEVEINTDCKRFERITKADMNGFKAVIGSDICFWENLVAPLAELTERALAAGVERVIITDPGRPPFFRLANRLAKRHKVKLQDWYALEPKRYEGNVLEVSA